MARSATLTHDEGELRAAAQSVRGRRRWRTAGVAEWIARVPHRVGLCRREGVASRPGRRPGARWWDSDRQPLAAVGAPAGDHVAPVGRGHAGSETELALTGKAFRLPGTLHSVAPYRRLIALVKLGLVSIGMRYPLGQSGGISTASPRVIPAAHDGRLASPARCMSDARRCKATHERARAMRGRSF